MNPCSHRHTRTLPRHPDLFEENRIHAEPPITAFQPRAAYNRDNVTLELLEILVGSTQVQDSMVVYGLLKEKKKVIPEQLKQGLLELVAFYNEEEAEEEGFEARGVLREVAARWRQGGFAEVLYSEAGLATEGGRLAMLLGYARHRNTKGAQQMWQECQANGDILPLEAHHAFLASLPEERLEKNMAAVRDVLGKLAEKKIQPTTETLVTVLQVLTTTARGPEYQLTCTYALDLLAEFKQAGVFISLGVYKVLLDIFVDTKASGQKSTILVDILQALEGQDMWPAKSQEDFNFFPRAMQVAFHLHRPELSWQINQLLLTGENLALVSHLGNSNSYYSNFLQNVLQNDTFEQAIDLYNQVTPHLWSPNSNYFKNLLHTIHSHGAINHIGKVYDDLALGDFAGANKETTYDLQQQVLQLLVANPPEASQFEGLGEVWIDIARRIFQYLEASKDNRSFNLRFNLMAANICSMCLQIHLNQANLEDSLKVLRFSAEHSTVMPGQLSDPTLKQLGEQCVALGEAEAALEVVAYSLNMASQTALPLATLSHTSLQLSDSQKEYLNKLFVSDPAWKPV